MVEPNSMAIMRSLSKTTNQIAEREVLQLLNIRNANVSQTEYFNVIEQKTAGTENMTLRKAIKTADASNIDSIVNILCSVNAFEFTRKIAENESQKALKSIKNIPDSEYRSALNLLCELSLNRTS